MVIRKKTKRQEYKTFFRKKIWIKLISENMFYKQIKSTLSINNQW